MKNLTQFLLLGCLAVTSSVFSQNTNIDSPNKNNARSVKRIVKSVKVIPEEKVNLPQVNTLPLESVIQKDQLSSANNEEAEYEYEYDNEFQAPKNQLSNTPVEPEVEYEPEYEYEAEYEYETKDNQLSSVSGDSYEEYEYEYDVPVSNSLNDPEAEYEYE